MQHPQWKSRGIIFLVLIASGLVAVQAGQSLPDRFSWFWGSKYAAPLPTSSPNKQLDTASPLRAVQHKAVDSTVDRMHHWNQIAIDTSGVDHSPIGDGESGAFGEQLGPGRATRAMAIVHIAIFDALNSISHTYRGFSGIPDVPATASTDAAVAQAAHDTLVALFPAQKQHCDALLVEDLASIPDSADKLLGMQTGQRAAARVLEMTARDGSNHAEPVVGVDYFPRLKAGHWRPEPVSGIQVAMGAHWGSVRPMVIRSATAYRVPAPPSLQSQEYARAYEEVKRLGGDGITTPTIRTEEQTLVGLYWAYDGTPSLCAPPRLYNQIAMTIADQMGTTGIELARLLALVNVTMSDAAITAWESKFHWNFWRPVTGIREADSGTGPRGTGDQNPLTAGDPTFTPLGAPASNLSGPDFTPPFPAYPSGHAVIGAGVFQTLRHFYGMDEIPFTFVSDELNGETRDHNGVLRPLVPRTFASLSQAEEENGQSRIYLGIHWSFDKTEGIKQGRQVANEVFRKAALRR